MLRQRSSFSSEEFLLDPPMLQQAIHKPAQRTPTYAYFCLYFSFGAVLFLFILATLLDQNSMYIQIKPVGNLTKKDLAKSVKYAACLYGLLGIFCLVLICLHRVAQSHGNTYSHLIEYEEGIGTVSVEKDI